MFVATHVHAPELCPTDDPEKLKKTFGLLSQENHAKKTKVKVIEAYLAAPEHTWFYILEADNYKAISDFFRLEMKIGTHRIVQVSLPSRQLAKRFGIVKSYSRRKSR